MDSFELKATIAEIDKGNYIVTIAPDGGFPPIAPRRLILSAAELTAIFKLLMEMASENTPVK